MVAIRINDTPDCRRKFWRRPNSSSNSRQVRCNPLLTAMHSFERSRFRLTCLSKSLLCCVIFGGCLATQGGRGPRGRGLVLSSLRGTLSLRFALPFESVLFLAKHPVYLVSQLHQSGRGLALRRPRCRASASFLSFRLAQGHELIRYRPPTLLSSAEVSCYACL